MQEYILSFSDNYRFLSNFHPVKVRFMGVDFGSTEAAYQAAKMTTQEDFKSFSHLSAGESKKRGRLLPLRPDWDDIKISVMARLLKRKFSSENMLLRNLLIDTHPKILVEGNYWGDVFWGMVKKHKDLPTDQIESYRGENNLGILLMKLRDDILKVEK